MIVNRTGFPVLRSKPDGGRDHGDADAGPASREPRDHANRDEVKHHQRDHRPRHVIQFPDVEHQHQSHQHQRGAGPAIEILDDLHCIRLKVIPNIRPTRAPLQGSSDRTPIFEHARLSCGAVPFPQEPPCRAVCLASLKNFQPLSCMSLIINALKLAWPAGELQPPRYLSCTRVHRPLHKPPKTPRRRAENPHRRQFKARIGANSQPKPRFDNLPELARG